MLPNLNINDINRSILDTFVESTFSLTLTPACIGGTPTAPTATVVSGSGLGNGTYSYQVTFVTGVGETLPSVASNVITSVSPSTAKVNLTNIPLGVNNGQVGVTSRKIYRTFANGSTYYLVTTIADNTTTTYTDQTADASLGAGVPTSDTSNSPWASGAHTDTVQYGRIGSMCWIHIIGSGGSPGSHFYWPCGAIGGTGYYLIGASGSLPTAITPTDTKSITSANIYNDSVGQAARIDVLSTGGLLVYAGTSGVGFSALGNNGFAYDCTIWYHI